MLKKRMDMIFLNIKDLKSFKYYYIKLKFFNFFFYKYKI